MGDSKVQEDDPALERISAHRRIQFSPGLGVVFIILFFSLFALIFGRVIIQNDGITYYALTLSLIRDHDFDLTNQSHDLPDLRVTIKRDGKAVCHYSCGFAVLYSPFLWLMTFLATLIPPLREWHPYGQNVIFPMSHSLAIFIATGLFGLLTLLLSCKLLRYFYQAPTISGILIPIAFFIGTPLMFYTFTTPSFNQAPDTFLITLACIIAVFWNRHQRQKSLRNIFFGFTLALSISLRNNNFVLIPIFVGYILWLDREEGWKKMGITALEVFAGAFPVGILQAFYNVGQYGHIFATGYRINLVQDFAERVGSGMRFYPILIHPSAGNFVWSPLTAISTIGLIVGAFRKRPIAIFSLLAVTLAVLSLRFAGVIWPGAAFGQRYLTHLYVFWVIGFYEIFQLWKRPVAILGTITCLWGFLLLNAYYIKTAYPDSRKLLAESDLHAVTPLGYVKAMTIGYQSFQETNENPNIMKYWWHALNSRPYPNLQYIMRNPHLEPKTAIRKKRKATKAGIVKRQ